jgi:hypothetical protein
MILDQKWMGSPTSGLREETAPQQSFFFSGGAASIEEEEPVLRVAGRLIAQLVKRQASEAPISKDTQHRAMTMLALSSMLAREQNLPFMVPSLSSEGNGNLCAEWWQGKERSLSLFVGADGSISYLRAWGPNMHQEMEDGELEADSQIAGLWHWLIRG